MATTITAGNATDGLKITPDNTGILELKTGTGAGTTALTLNASQNATVAGTLQVAGISTNMYPIVSGTAITLTNQTAPEFTGIPSWAKRITVMFDAVSTNGTGIPQVQIGTSGGIQTTSYISYLLSNSSTNSITTGFSLNAAANQNAATQIYGFLVLSLLDSATGKWVASWSLGVNAAGAVGVVGGGSKTLSGTLDRVRLYVDGTQQFDAGTINIMWE